jgi:ABC-type transporter Mla maintaining outer membrane lipid asymmetry ATPase subunit MlaF
VAPVVAAEWLSKRYRATLALDALELSVPAGELFRYLGPNGSGEIRLLLGLHRPPRPRRPPGTWNVRLHCRRCRRASHHRGRH